MIPEYFYSEFTGWDDKWHDDHLTTVKNKYEISAEQFSEMLHQQNGTCAMCHTKHWDVAYHRLCVDHDHKTGKARGLLCHKCNRLVGQYEHGKLRDSVLYARARAYISSHV